MSGQINRPLGEEHGVTLAELAVTMAIFAMIMLGVVSAWSKAQEAYFVGSEAAEVQQNARAAIDFIVRDLRAAGRDVTVCTFDYAAPAGTADCNSAKITRCTTLLAGTGTPTWQNGNGLSGGGPGCTGLFAIPYQEATATTIRIRSDRNDNGRIAGMGNSITSPASAADPGGEDVKYALATTSPPCPTGVVRCITRDDGTGPVAMVAVDISGFALTYYPRPNFGPCAGQPNPCSIAFGALTSQSQADNIGKITMTVTALQSTAGASISRTVTTDVVLLNRR